MKYLVPDVLALATSGMKPSSRRFEAAFHAAWKQIPAEARDTITNYLRERRGWVYLCFRMEHDHRPVSPFGRACWGDDKTAFTFLAPLFELCDTEQPLRAVIAHELAHCCRRGNGTWTAIEEDEERGTRALAGSWGFGDPGFGDKAHWQGWEELVEAWRQKNKKFAGETESRWLGFAPAVPIADAGP